jgi:hypothetical protein
VALDDGGDVLGADAMKTEIKAAAQFAPFSHVVNRADSPYVS